MTILTYLLIVPVGAILSDVVPVIAVKLPAVTSANDELSALDCNFTAMLAELSAVQCRKACPPNAVDEPKSTAVVVAVALVLVRAYMLKPLPKLSPVNVEETPTASLTEESIV
jgi:hypothetical protein